MQSIYTHIHIYIYTAVNRTYYSAVLLNSIIILDWIVNTMRIEECSGNFQEQMPKEILNLFVDLVKF